MFRNFLFIKKKLLENILDYNRTNLITIFNFKNVLFTFDPMVTIVRHFL